MDEETALRIRAYYLGGNSLEVVITDLMLPSDW